MKQGIIIEKGNINAVIMTNDGQFLSVPTKASWQIGETVTTSDFDLNLASRHKKDNYKKQFVKKNRKILIAIVASLLLFLMPFSLITEASTYVTLDINPSIELELKNNEVINIRALNADGERLIIQFNKEIDSKDNNDIFSVTTLILEQAEKMGYLKTTEENIIMIGVSETKEFKSSEYEQFIQTELSGKSLYAQVVVLNATSNEKKLADKKGISLGRQLLLEKEKNEGVIISDEQITNESIKSIFSKIEEEKRKNDLKNEKNDNNVNEDAKQDGLKDNEKKEENKDKDSSTDKSDVKNNQVKQEEKTQQNNEENKKKAENKKKLEKKAQEKQKEDIEAEKVKIEEKEEQNEQEEKREEQVQNKQSEENQGNQSKEYYQDNEGIETNQANENEEK